MRIWVWCATFRRAKRSLSLLFFVINIHMRHWGKRRQEASREWHFRAALFHFLQSGGLTVPRHTLLYCLLSLLCPCLEFFIKAAYRLTIPWCIICCLYSVQIWINPGLPVWMNIFLLLFSDLSKVHGRFFSFFFSSYFTDIIYGTYKWKDAFGGGFIWWATEAGSR